MANKKSLNAQLMRIELVKNVMKAFQGQESLTSDEVKNIEGMTPGYRAKLAGAGVFKVEGRKAARYYLIRGNRTVEEIATLLNVKKEETVEKVVQLSPEQWKERALKLRAQSNIQTQVLETQGQELEKLLRANTKLEAKVLLLNKELAELKKELAGVKKMQEQIFELITK
jgi:predicted RNase H-like nuclease (RuvC/YqgF family)